MTKLTPPPSRPTPELPRFNREQSTIQVQVTDALRRMIIDGSLAPGAKIGEEWVSNEMEVSRGPVREAIRALEHEGLVVVNAYRGAHVNGITDGELRDVLIPIRLILESEACLRALPAMTEADFTQLRGLVAEMRRAALEDTIPDQLLRIVDLDVSFHEYLTQLGGQYHTLQIWRLIQSRIRAGFYKLGPAHLGLQEIADEHDVLLDALRTRDPETVTAALTTHICTTQIALLEQAQPVSQGG